MLEKMMRMNRDRFRWLNCFGVLVFLSLSFWCVGQQGLGYGMWSYQKMRDDQAIVLEIKRALDLDPHLKNTLIHVKCKGGRVNLAGVVDSPFKAVRAEGVATTITGVVSVKNKIKVVVLSENSKKEK